MARCQAPGGNSAADFVAARGGLNQSARLTDEVKRAINAQDFNAAADDLIRTRAATAGPAYQRALAIETPVDVKPIIDDISARLSTAKGDIKARSRRRRGCFGIALASLTPRLAGATRDETGARCHVGKTPTNSISRVARRELDGRSREAFWRPWTMPAAAPWTACAAFARPVARD